jgi:hypothetical protein
MDKNVGKYKYKIIHIANRKAEDTKFWGTARFTTNRAYRVVLCSEKK